MAIQITSGRIIRPRKVVIYGPEGVGKTSLASDLPNPIFLDCERGSEDLDVARIRIESMADIREALKMLRKGGHDFKTVVVDTIDWLEKDLQRELCAKRGWSDITDPGYGDGYKVLEEEFQALLLEFSTLVDKGMNIVLLAHSTITKYTDPEQAAAYDRYQLKLEKKTAPLAKEWPDALWFFNYVTKTSEREKDQSHRGVGGKKRAIYTEHTAAFDGKKRKRIDGTELPLIIEIPKENPAKGILCFFPEGEGEVVKVEGANNEPQSADAERDPDAILNSIIVNAGGEEPCKAFLTSLKEEFPPIGRMRSRILGAPRKFIDAVEGFVLNAPKKATKAPSKASVKKDAQDARGASAVQVTSADQGVATA